TRSQTSRTPLAARVAFVRVRTRPARMVSPPRDRHSTRRAQPVPHANPAPSAGAREGELTGQTIGSAGGEGDPRVMTRCRFEDTRRGGERASEKAPLPRSE